MNAIARLSTRAGLLTATALLLAAVPSIAQPQLSPVILNERFDTYINGTSTDCGSFAGPNQSAFEAVWPRDLVEFPIPAFNTNSWQVANLCETGTRGFSSPVSLMQKKGESHRNVRRLTNEIAAAFPGYNGVNGTLTNPLQLEVYIDADSARFDASQQNIVVELTGPGSDGLFDMAPNNDVIVGTDLVTPCSADSCVQTPPNPHSSIAVGIFANLDPEACDNCTNPRRTQYVALFDGEQWWQLHPNHPVDDGVGIEVSKRRNKIRVTIYADTITVWSDSNEFGIREKANIPRKYKGPFDRIALGLMVPIPEASGQEPGTIDDLYLSGGVGENAVYKGACCIPGGGCQVLDESQCAGNWSEALDCSQVECSGACCVGGLQGCIETDAGTCAAQSGQFNGYGTVCASTDCCGDPFADTDYDQDVDQDDFGVFQVCFTGSTAASLSSACKCLDREPAGGDGVIGEADLSDFADCITGPEIPFNLSPPAGCAP